MSVNTNYGIRPVTQGEIIATFGSMRHANHVTRDPVERLFFIHNPDKVPPDMIKQAAAREAAPRRGRKGETPPSIAEVSRRANTTWRMTKAVLVEMGLVEK